MRIALVNIPIEAPWLSPPSWVTVPPQTYGGIQWFVANLIDGLLELGHEVILLGAPGSPSKRRLNVINIGQPAQIREWLAKYKDAYDVIHDHSVGSVFQDAPPVKPYLGTWHLTGAASYPCNPVYLSKAQRLQAKAKNAPVIRIPVNPNRYLLREQKEQELLFLGRVSPWKGVLEAAEFATRCNRHLLIAGPTWDEPYRHQIEKHFSANVTFLGEVGGNYRSELLQKATAVLVLSQSVAGPWGDQWVEPGATVVSEAAASGTPVIASSNGCLREIVPGVGVVIDEGEIPFNPYCREILETLPSPSVVRAQAIATWNHIIIASQYIELYQSVQSNTVDEGR